MKDKIKKINKIQTEFLIVSIITLTISITGIFMFIKNGKYIIHPFFYIIGILMGLGWFLSAIISIFEQKK